MKTILLSFLIAFGGIGIQRLNLSLDNGFTLSKQIIQETKRCIGINRKNKQCGNSANIGSNYCIWHEPKSLRYEAIARSTGRR